MPTRSDKKPRDTSSSAALDQVADELYGLAPEEFTAARARHEKRARQDGDRELAAAIHRLAKPSAAAWLANQLVRERRDELLPLTELGADLRRATERLAGDELRQLSRRRQELVYALVQRARQLARATGHPVSEATVRGLEDTFHAALADEQAAEQLLAGRLSRPMERHVFADGPAGTDARAPAREASDPPKRHPPRGDEELRRAERDLVDAQRALDDLTKARAEAQGQAAVGDRAAQAARDQVELLRSQLEEATAAASRADQHSRELAAALRRVERAASDAERRTADAKGRRDHLADVE